MECNKDEATRAKEIAENKMKINDFEGARKFLFKARQMYPQLEDITQLLTVCNVHCSAKAKLNGGKDMDFYGILQIERFSDEASVKKQYKKLALSLHPDKNKFPGAEAAFKLVGEANMVLTDPAKRSSYDIKCGVPARTPIPKHAFHQSNQFFHAMKQEHDLNEASRVPCSQSSSSHTCQQSSSVNLSERSLGSKERKTKENELKSENANKTGFDTRPPEKAGRRKPEVVSRGASHTGMNGDESKKEKTKESAAKPKSDSRKPKEDDLKTKNASKNGFSELKTGNSSKSGFGSRPLEKVSRQADKRAESSTSKRPSRKRGRVPEVESSEGFDAERNDDKSNGSCESVKIVLGLQAGKLYDSKRKKPKKNDTSTGHQNRKSARLMQNVS